MPRACSRKPYLSTALLHASQRTPPKDPPSTKKDCPVRSAPSPSLRFFNFVLRMLCKSSWEIFGPSLVRSDFDVEPRALEAEPLSSYTRFFRSRAASCFAAGVNATEELSLSGCMVSPPGTIATVAAVVFARFLFFSTSPCRPLYVAAAGLPSSKRGRRLSMMAYHSPPRTNSLDVNAALYPAYYKRGEGAVDSRQNGG